MPIDIIPGPEEAQHHINSLLKPVVDDLLFLYEGIEIRDVVMLDKRFNSHSVLLPVLRDIPASRKVSQFLSHKANKPCDKCHKTAKRKQLVQLVSFITDDMPKKEMTKK